MEKRKRILWLFNHTSLRKTQVPLLIDLGYEVYCPKIYSFEWGDFSGSVSYEYDDSLSLERKEIEKLNQIDFYDSIPVGIMNFINSCFDIVFCITVPEIVERFLIGFHGCIIVQGFGLYGYSNYTELLSYSYKGSASLGTLRMIKKKKERFWFAFSYSNLETTESPILQGRSLYLPIGLKNAIPQRKWVGGDSRILFVSPKIKTNSYYYQVYRDFCDNFGDIPHVIGGAQLQPVAEDPTVTGFLSDAEYAYNMTHLAAMFYHSQEPRHLHYHPLEAVKWGMPLIFMAGGMLDHLGGVDLPGRARTIREARKKLKRLLAGDKKFIREVTSSQEKLLKPFTDEYCRPYWIKGMEKIEQSLRREKDYSDWKKIAVILPAAYTGGVYDYAMRFALAVQTQIHAHNAKARLVFAYPRNKEYEKKDYFSTLRKSGIQVREFLVETRSRAWADSMLHIAGYQPKLKNLPVPERVNILRDGMSDFLDCDYAFFMSDTAGFHPMLFLCPYTMVVHDYIQRYVPAAVSTEMDMVKCCNQQHARSVFVTSEPTRQDAIQHACIAPERVILTPPLLTFPERKNLPSNDSDYFLWSTNEAPHKNHCKALEALEAYYREGGILDCVITGANTQYFLPGMALEDAPVPRAYVSEIQEKIHQSEFLGNHLSIKGHLPKEAYEQCLAGACFVFHPGYGDNGNFTVTDAAALGVPSLASDYPAMRYLAEYAGISVKYMNPFEPMDMAKSLREMEREYVERAKELPAAEVLQQKSYTYQAECLYRLVREQIDFEEER